MKNLYLISLALLIFIAPSLSQERYSDKIFDKVIIDSVVYAKGKLFDGKIQELKLDIYQPEGDLQGKRPLIIMAHGGAFLTNNSKRDSEIVDWCTTFAQKGYVCVALQYRVGILFDLTKLQSEFANATWRATLDFREAIKYLKHRANDFRVDTNQFYGIGISAGAIALFHAQMLDLPSELNSANPPIDTLGKSLEFNTNIFNYSPKIKAFVNICGAIGEVNWMKNNLDYSLLNIHGDKDPTIPYKTDVFKAGPFPIAKISGSFSIDSMANILGMSSELYTFKGAEHVPFSPRNTDKVRSKAYMDTTVLLMKDFLFKSVKKNSVGVDLSVVFSSLKIYPNPAKDVLQLNFEQAMEGNLKITDCMNKTILTKYLNQERNCLLDVSNFNSGLYIIHFDINGRYFSRKIIIE
ncbi:MAG: T9SS C-terminal target domain-containing protein [Cytophagales bacterium]|nr:MAG: T9SS C-terminal target domain-containing protein [Cytophagales bacterium]